MKTQAAYSESNCENYVVLYSEYSFGGGVRHFHGDCGSIATDCNTWNEKSFDKNGGATIYVAGRVDTSVSTQNYSGYIEEYNPDCATNLLTYYPSPVFPLYYYCVDKTLVTPVRISLSSLESTFGTVALAASSVIPYSSTPFTSITIANGVNGTLGFIDNTPNTVVAITLKIGVMDKSTGQVNWQTNASLTLNWDGMNLNITNSTLPSEWSLTDVTLLPDNTWTVSVFQNVLHAVHQYITFTDEYFSGAGDAMAIDNTMAIKELTTTCSEWRMKSLGIYPPTPSANFTICSSFPNPPLNYSFNNYNIVKSKANISDLPLAFGHGALPAISYWVDDDKFPTWLELMTTSLEYSVIIIGSPVSRDYYFTSKNRSGYFCNSTQPQDVYNPLDLIYGSLDASGVLIPAGQGQVVVDFTDGYPVVTTTGLPASLLFSVGVKQADNNWLVTLTESIA